MELQRNEDDEKKEEMEYPDLQKDENDLKQWMKR